MARAKHVGVKANKLVSFFLSRCFLKEIENMYSMFLSSYRATRGSLLLLLFWESSKKLWKRSPAASCSFVVLPNVHSCFNRERKQRRRRPLEKIELIFYKRNSRLSRSVRYVYGSNNVLRLNMQRRCSILNGKTKN